LWHWQGKTQHWTATNPQIFQVKGQNVVHAIQNDCGLCSQVQDAICKSLTAAHRDDRFDEASDFELAEDCLLALDGLPLLSRKDLYRITSGSHLPQCFK
jgi:hypothetical protein